MLQKHIFKKASWASLWASFRQTHLATLDRSAKKQRFFPASKNSMLFLMVSATCPMIIVSASTF
jgi:hypothetical protein